MSKPQFDEKSLAFSLCSAAVAQSLRLLGAAAHQLPPPAASRNSSRDNSRSAGSTAPRPFSALTSPLLKSKNSPTNLPRRSRASASVKTIEWA